MLKEYTLYVLKTYKQHAVHPLRKAAHKNQGKSKSIHEHRHSLAVILKCAAYMQPHGGTDGCMDAGMQHMYVHSLFQAHPS